MAYKAPIWEDGKSPAISAENLNNLSQAAEGAQVLYGNSVPTSSTEGAVGQFYLVVVADSDGNYPLYQCVAIANGSYTWRDTRRIPDSITSMLGIPAPGTINRALNVLANVGNLHVWDRTIVLDEEIPAGYELGPVSNGSFVIGGNSSRQDSTWTYGTEISVDDGGNVSLTGDTATVSGYNSYTGELVSTLGILVGKFAKCTDTGTTIGIPENTIVFFPEDAVVTKTTRDSDTVAVINKYQSVEGHKKIPAGTTTDYLTSTDRNAYPDQSAEGGQDAYYTLGDVVTGSFMIGSTASGYITTWRYGTSVSISDDGTLSLSGTTGTVDGTSSLVSDYSVLNGKFVYVNSNYSNIALNDGKIYFIPSDANIKTDGSMFANMMLDKYQPVTGHAAIPANTTITYLGQLGGGARIEVGSYVGTGTYGSSNPNSLTFWFEPKAVLFWSPDNNQTIAYVYGGTTIFGFYQNYSDDRDSATCSLSGNTLSWYASDARCQGNVSGTTYYYTAIG